MSQADTAPLAATAPSERISTQDWQRLSACPICGSRHTVPFRQVAHEGIAVRHEICRSCSLVFLNPRPPQGWYDSMFADEYWEDKARQRGDDVRQHMQQFRAQLLRADRYIAFLESAKLEPSKGANIMEIGCAYGLIVKRLAEHSKAKAIGAEASHIAFAFARDVTGVDMVAHTAGELGSANLDGIVDLLYFSHVLEYIVDVEQMLADVRRVLKPGGVLLIATPDIYFRHATHLHHPYCFCKKSLHELLARNGFEVVHTEPPGWWRPAFTPNFVVVTAAISTPAGAVRSSPNLTSSSWPEKLMKAGQAWFTVANRFPANRALRWANGQTQSLNAEQERWLQDLIDRAATEPA